MTVSPMFSHEDSGTAARRSREAAPSCKGPSSGTPAGDCHADRSL
jgi:hypothetical protein